MAAATTMQALNYHGPYSVKVVEVEKPKVEHPDDVIVKVTTVCVFCELGSIGNMANMTTRLRSVVLTCSKLAWSISAEDEAIDNQIACMREEQRLSPELHLVSSRRQKQDRFNVY